MSWFKHGESRIYYEDEGQGSPVVFMPGWSESIDEFRDLRDALSRKFRVIAADLPGSGKSGPQPRSYAATYYQDDARSILALVHELGISPAHVLGFSDGGEVALVMAVMDSGALRSIVAWGAAGELAAPPGMLDAFSNLVDAPIEPMREFSGHLKATYGEANASDMTRSVVAAWRAILGAGGDISSAGAASIACPALLITGEHDFFAPPDAVSGLARTIPGGEFIQVEGAEHSLHVEHADWLATTILDFLARHDS